MEAPGSSQDGSASRRLQERIARALGHDLRSPLGAIANYATLLDAEAAADATARRDATARIRRQVATITDAAQHLADALKIAAAPEERRTGEPVALLRVLASELGLGVALKIAAPAATPTPSVPDAIALDARRVAYALRAFFTAERSGRPQLPGEAELRVTRVDDRAVVEVGFDGALGAAPEYVVPKGTLALEVAGDLLAESGATLEIAGAPGRSSALRLRLPPAALAAVAPTPASERPAVLHPLATIQTRLHRHLVVLRTAVKSFNEVGPFQLAAALSYYMLLSLAPLVLVTVTVASLVFGRESVGARLVVEVEKAAGRSAADVVRDVIARSAQSGTSGVLLVVGVISVLIGATSVFVQLEDALNRIWRVRGQQRHGVVWSYLRGRVLSLAMVIGIGFLLLVSLLVSAALSAFLGWLGAAAGSHWVAQTVDVLVSAFVITGLFAMILKVLPAVHVAWGDVWFGAIVTSLFFTAGKNMIALYLGRAGVGSAYGAAGSVVVLMVWVYYAALILLFGAQLTQARVQVGNP